MGCKLSLQGHNRIDRIRKAKGWNKGDPRWIAVALTSEATLRRFWRGVPIRQETFQSICAAVGVDWRDLVERPIDTGPAINLSFLGREATTNDFQEFLHQGHKLILIQGEAGIGKTTVAREFLADQSFERVLKLDSFTTPIEIVVQEWLEKYFQETPSSHFSISLSRLRSQLQEHRVGILIDGLETILQQGRVRPEYQDYIEFLKTLSDGQLQSFTLITSREPLHEPELSGKNLISYKLRPLSLAAWNLFLSDRKITIEPTALEEMHRAYGGNAQAMKLLSYTIHEESQGNLAYWWKRYQNNLLCHPPLNSLIEHQFQKLKQDSPLAYKLLCRMGVYPYPVAEEEVLALLRDVEYNQHKSVLQVLKDCALVQSKNERYSLYPIVREQALELLNSDLDISQQPEERKTLNPWFSQRNHWNFSSTIVSGKGEWKPVSSYRYSLFPSVATHIPLSQFIPR